MWGSRWGYGESVAVVLGLLLVGTLWEWLLPPLSLGALGGGLEHRSGQRSGAAFSVVGLAHSSRS